MFISERLWALAYAQPLLRLKAPTTTAGLPGRYGLVMLEATPEGMWIDYVYLNPNTGFRELKYSWVVRHDDLIFGSGWYELQRPSIVEFVQEAPAAAQQALQVG